MPTSLSSCLLAALWLAVSSSAIVAQDNRPNFILMIADDMAFDDCGAAGHPHIRTPNLDKLAQSGMVFEQAFLTCSSCSPSRSSIITCRYPHMTDAEQLHWPLPADQETFVRLLKEAGYYTAASGKWHLGSDAKKHFDRVNETPTAGFRLRSDAQGGAITKSDKNNASGCANWVATLAARPKDRPFFLWLAAIDPHRNYAPNTISRPHQPADAVLPPYIPDTPEVRRDFALYYDEIARLDYYVGSVLEALEVQGVSDNTVVIFISDNGRPFPRCKTTVFDSGIQTPLFVRWPGKIAPNSRTQSLVSSIDIGTTILDLAGIPKSNSMLGESFGSVLSDPATPHRNYIFAEHNWHDYDANQRGVRSAQFKYIRNFDSELTLSPPADAVRSPTFRAMQQARDEGVLGPDQRQCFVAPRAQEEFYDLESDPHELTNVATVPKYAKQLQRHQEILRHWRSTTDDAERTVRSDDEFDRETGDPLPNRRPRGSKAEMRKSS